MRCVLTWPGEAKSRQWTRLSHSGRALPDRARATALTLRFTAPLSTDYWDWLDYTIVEDGRRDMHGPHSSHSNMKTSRDWPGIEIGDQIGHPRNLLPSYPDRY